MSRADGRRLRGFVAAVVAASAGGALLLPIAARSREIEARARIANARFDRTSTRAGDDRHEHARRIEGTPRDVFAWLREIESAPPSAPFVIDLSIDRTSSGEPVLAAELHPQQPETDR
jgi:hypothetical protein